MAALRPWWERHQRIWVSVEGPDTSSRLAGERVFWSPEVSLRTLHRLPGAVFRAVRLLRRERPDLVLSAGSGVAIGVFIAAKLLRVPTMWLETLNIVTAPGLTSRFCMSIASATLVQRPELLGTRPRAVLVGELY